MQAGANQIPYTFKTTSEDPSEIIQLAVSTLETSTDVEFIIENLKILNNVDAPPKTKKFFVFSWQTEEYTTWEKALNHFAKMLSLKNKQAMSSTASVIDAQPQINHHDSTVAQNRAANLQEESFNQIAALREWLEVQPGQTTEQFIRKMHELIELQASLLQSTELSQEKVNTMVDLTGANSQDKTLILFQKTNQMWQNLKKTLLSEAETSHNISLDELVVAAAEEAKERVPLLIGSLLNDQHANLPKDTRFEADLFTGILLKKMSEINIPAASDYKTNRNALNTAAVVLTSFTCNTIKGLKSKTPSPFVNYIKEQAKYEARLVFKRDSETESCISTRTQTKDEETLHRRTVRLADFQETLNFDDMIETDKKRYADAEMSVSLKRLIVHEHPEQEALLQGVSKINFEIAAEKLKSAATYSPDSSPNRARRGSNDVSTPNSSTHSTASSCSPTSGSKLAAENMRINSLQSQLDRAILQQEDNGTSEELERTITDLKRQLADLKGTDTISDTGIASRNLFGSDLGQKPKYSAENSTHLQQLKASTSTNPDLENATLSLGEGLNRTGDTVQEDGSPDSTYSSQKNKI